MLKLLSKAKTAERSYLYIFTASIFVAFHYFFVTYINSTFLLTQTSQFWVGILYSLGATLTIITLYRLPKYIEMFGLYKVIVFISSVNILALYAISHFERPYLIFISFIIHHSIPPLLLTCLDTAIEDQTSEKCIGKTRGMFLTTLAVASVASPLVVGGIIADSGFKAIYLYSLFFMALFLIVIFASREKFVQGTYKVMDGLDSLKEFFSVPDIKRIAIANFALHFFFSWMIIYVPIYLHTNMGFDWSEIGIMISITLIPFIILEIPVGELADEVMGEKELLIFGITCMTIACITFPILGYGQFIAWTLIILFGRIGASISETMIEGYFFKKCKDHDELISIFRMSQPTAFIIGPLVGSISLLFVPFRFIFPILSIVLLISLLFVMRLNDTK